MTIPEASGLVMQAGAMAKRGELFVLDMGKPVKIIDLAVNMIRFSGFEPYRDIMIEEIGLRPGEKLYEELLVKKDDMQKTENELIFIENEDAPSREEVEEKLEYLRKTVAECEGDVPSAKITEALKSVVPSFRSADEVNVGAESAEEMKNAAVVES
jgi:FlaA1/EpsC-like NDP-sugar epimerase